MKKMIVATSLTLGMAAAYAQAPDVRFVGSLAVTGGGDTLASGTYTNGNAWNVSAGGGVQFSIGADFRVAENVRIQATVGSHVDKTNASNGDIAFKRSPFEVLAMYDLNPNMRIGGGLRKAANAELTATGVASGLGAAGSYASTMGAVFEWQYLFNPAQTSERRALWTLNLRLVAGESYTQAGTNVSKSGGHVGLGVNLYY